MKTNLSENENIILEHLKNYPLTIRQVQLIYGINNPYDVILRLKKYGHDIIKERRTNNKKRFAVYHLIRVV